MDSRALLQRVSLQQKLSNLIENLPKITRIKNKCGEIDLYGVRHTIAEKAGLKSTPKTKTRWYHGWNALPLNDPKLLVTCGNFELKNFTYLTNTQPEADLLSRNGFKNATAVGSNFSVYKTSFLTIKNTEKCSCSTNSYDFKMFRLHQYFTEYRKYNQSN